MATVGSVLNDFVSQNAIILMAGVLITVIVIAASTYYIARIYLPSNSLNTLTTNSERRNETSHAEQPKDTGVSEAEEDGAEGDEGQQPTIDPVYYCEHIQGEIKKVKQDVTTRKICESLSPEQIAEERQRQRDQLAEIFKLMQDQQDKFGISSMDEMQEQMRLYADIK